MQQWSPKRRRREYLAQSARAWDSECCTIGIEQPKHGKSIPRPCSFHPPLSAAIMAAPQLTLVRVSQVQPIALTGLAGPDPIGLRGQAVDVKVVYGDPLTAPLALRPEEVWWVSGAHRRFGPVREVVARFVVVSGLWKFGYPVDQAVINEALPDAPRIPTAHYGMRPKAGRVFEQLSSDSPQRLLKGELVMGSARWWERAEAVTPPAVSANTPSVWASRIIASTISSSFTSSPQPPVSRINFALK